MTMTGVALRAAQGLGDAVGRAVCARAPGHGLWSMVEPTALCARCTAMHVALAVTLLLLLASGRGPTRRPVTPVMLGLALLGPIAVDIALIRTAVSSGSTASRVTTGALAGSGLGLLLAVALRRAPGTGPLALAAAAGALAGTAVVFVPRGGATALSSLAAAAVVFNLGAAMTAMARALRDAPQRSDWVVGATAACALVAVLSWRP